MAGFNLRKVMDKKTQIVLFSSTAIALYGYDQGMMSLINTNKSYLSTMGISGDSPIVGVIVSVYYLCCAVGAVIASKLADAKGRRPGIFACLATASLGNILMFIARFGKMGRSPSLALATMILGRVVMGLGVGANLLPETPRWPVLNGEEDSAKLSIARVFGKAAVEERIRELLEAQKQEEEDGTVSYADMLFPSGSQFHPTVIVVMGQVNQALTWYGAVSVYGPQIFELLGFSVTEAEYITLGNYIFYFLMMTLAWVLIDRVGRRRLMLQGSLWLSASFALLTLLGGLAYNRQQLSIPLFATGIPGIIVLYAATAVFGIGWLVPPWLIPTEIFPSTARAQGAAISVIIWGLANFTVTLLTPIGFNNLEYFLLLVFATTNAVAWILTYLYCPESGHRTFEENQEFFKEAADEGSWFVARVGDGRFRNLPGDEADDEESERGQQSSDADSHSGGRDRQAQKKGAEGSETSPLLR